MTDKKTKLESSRLEDDFDPLFLSARREAIWIILIFLVFAPISLTVSLTLGWNTTGLAAESTTTAINERVSNYVFGMPAWVFYGVLLPWIFATVVSIAFAFFVLKDGSLEDEQDNSIAAKAEQDVQ